MNKPKAYRKTGMLRPIEMTRTYIASQIREWRNVGEVKKYRYADCIAYQSSDHFNPYMALVDYR